MSTGKARQQLSLVAGTCGRGCSQQCLKKQKKTGYSIQRIAPTNLFLPARPSLSKVPQPTAQQRLLGNRGSEHEPVVSRFSLPVETFYQITTQKEKTKPKKFTTEKLHTNLSGLFYITQANYFHCSCHLLSMIDFRQIICLNQKETEKSILKYIYLNPHNI